jgi:hypothetical protein
MTISPVSGLAKWPVVVAWVMVCFLCGGSSLQADCIPTGPEVPGNSIDEDCDGWLGTGHTFDLRAEHPRVLLTPDLLQSTIERMTGPAAREPYQTWFQLVRDREDTSQDVDLVNLALIYRATGDPVYLSRFLARRPTTGVPGAAELFAVDILWNQIPDADKLNIMARVPAEDNPWYWASINQSNSDPADVGWGYHSAYGVHRALAYAGAFALSPILDSPQVVNNPTVYNRFDTLNYLEVVDKELSPIGSFRRIENRVAGDPTANGALPGSPGGMYDNFGYDRSEEAHSIFVLSEFLMLTDQDRFTDMLHDRYRGTFYQNLQVPHRSSYAETDRWCRRAGTETHEATRIWFTQTGAWQPLHDAVALTATLYQDPRMQHYFSEGTQRVLCGPPYGGMWWDLVFYDDGLATDPPSTNPTAMYFNGPGLVSMREDWSNDALFAVFVAGEGISRRYEDANSFLLHRKTDIVPHAGARIRFNADNDKHHWYHVRSACKNTIKIFDPAESFDIDPGGTVGPLHSGPPLVASDNFGGQIFETPISSYDGCFSTSGCGSGIARYDCSAYPLGVCETADVRRFEHDPDQYTYTVGDGAAAYTRKIDLFERALVYLRPDVVVVFDRVRSVDPSFAKAWTLHTVPQPVASTTPIDTDLGMRRHLNERHISMENPLTVTYLDVLLPENNRTTIRGGDTILGRGPLRAGQPIPGGAIQDLDVPRWLELFAVGPDVEGEVVIQGDALEGTGISETVNFGGTVQTTASGAPTAMTSTTLQDTEQHWYADEWAGHVLRLRGGSSGDVVITGNDENTLSIAGGYEPSGVWGYYVLRPLANTANHWIRVDGVTTTDMDVDDFTVSVPHYFDAVNAAGELHSFSPRTDGADDGYGKRRDIGQWTVEVEATAPRLLDNFLHVFHLVDPGVDKVETELVTGAGVSGARVGGWLVVFANDESEITDGEVALIIDQDTSVLLTDLVVDTDYTWAFTGSHLRWTSQGGNGTTVRSSDQGTARFELRGTNPFADDFDSGDTSAWSLVHP